jgi:hypothetical protein
MDNAPIIYIPKGIYDFGESIFQKISDTIKFLIIDGQ